MTEIARTLPELFRAYATTATVPETPEDVEGIGRLRALLGAALVTAVSSLLAITVIVSIAQVVSDGPIVGGVIVLGGIALGMITGHLVASPLVDRLLGIPRVIEA